MDIIITYDVLTQVIQRLIRPFQAIIKQGNSKPLSPVEQVSGFSLSVLSR